MLGCVWYLGMAEGLRLSTLIYRGKAVAKGTDTGTTIEEAYFEMLFFHWMSEFCVESLLL